MQTIDTLFSTINSTSNLLLWHKRLGHRNLATISKLLNTPYSSKLDLDCKECIDAKLTNNISKEITNKALNYLDKVVLDLYRPITPSTLIG